jgi:hypothetical protein
MLYDSYCEFQRHKSVKANFPIGKLAALTENSSVNSLKCVRCNCSTVNNGEFCYGKKRLSY